MFTRCITTFILISVASNSWSASLQTNGDGTVTDFDAGLVWQQSDDNMQRTWDAANTYCNTLPLAGKSDWRLPQAKELASIVDYRVNNPSIDDAKFPGTNASYYWSASSYANNSASAWVVDFYDGGVDADDKTGTYYVRCVR